MHKNLEYSIMQNFPDHYSTGIELYIICIIAPGDEKLQKIWMNYLTTNIMLKGSIVRFSPDQVIASAAHRRLKVVITGLHNIRSALSACVMS